MRGADLLVRSLEAAGVEHLFALSGNQIMPIFDACVGRSIELVHVRHEAAAVHMADAWGRLTGSPGVALVTAGPGFANTLSALYVAAMAESPMVLLSGHAPTSRLGQAAFQEMPQAEMARHVSKASWTADSAAGLGSDLARAFRIAGSGRPGPVHVALPVDLLEAEVVPGPALPPEETAAPASDADPEPVRLAAEALTAARRPMALAGPAMARGGHRDAISSLADSAGLPVVAMESPRGVNDPSLGAFAEVLPRADLILLLGKRLDYSLGHGEAPAVDGGCRFIQVDPDPATLEQTRRTLDDPSRLEMACVGDPVSFAQRLGRLAESRELSFAAWRDEVESAVSHRPAEWDETLSDPEGPLHPVDVCRAVQEIIDGDTVLVSDGGEFGQWAQACLSAPSRIINGLGGSIGSAIPLSVAARLASPGSRVIAMLGDGTFGFHALELDTAVRYGLPLVAVVGNDAAWNAEYQIQLRDYGRDRLVGCELLPTRYSDVAIALGGYGERVSRLEELRPALQRALDSGLPACVDVRIDRNAAPNIRRSG